MQISEIAIRRPITTIMVFAALVMLGLVSLQRIPLLLLPSTESVDINVRINTSREFSNEEAERLLLIPIEGFAAQLEGVQSIETAWGGGWRSGATIQFHPNVDIQHRLIELQERLNSLQRSFERGEVRFFSFVRSSDFLNNRPMDLILVGPLDDPFFANVDIDDLESRIQQINGVSDINAWGGVRRVIEVEVKQDLLRQFGIPLNQVVNQVRNYANEPVVLGEIHDFGQRHFVRFDGQFSSVNELENIVLNPSGNIAVRHIGQAEMKIRERDSIFMSSGRPAISYRVEKTADVNPIAFSNRVRSELERINESMPPGYAFITSNDQADGILALIRLISISAFIGVLMALMILYAFIRNWRMTLVTFLVIPVCVIISFNFFYFGNMTLNIVTLIGLAVGVGSLIDKSIVIQENIFRHYQRGMSSLAASIRGSREIGWALFALTLTSVIVFLPIVFAESPSYSHRDTVNVISFLEHGALAIVFPILISMLMALTVAPMASARLLHLGKNNVLSGKSLAVAGGSSGSGSNIPSGGQSGASGHRSSGGAVSGFFCMRTWRRGYIRVLKTCIRYRVQLFLLVALLCAHTYYYTWENVARDATGPRDQLSFTIYLAMHEGSVMDHTVSVTSQLMEMIEEQVPEVDYINARVRADDVQIWVNLVDAQRRDRSSATIQEELRPYLENFAGGDASYTRRRDDGTGFDDSIPAGRRGSIEIRGPEITQLDTISANMSDIIEQIPGVMEAYPESESGPLQYHFMLDRDAAALFQITPNDIGSALRVAQRRNDFTTIQLKRDDREFDIVFAQIPSDQSEIGKDAQGLSEAELREIPVHSPAVGTTVSLDQLGNFQLVNEPRTLQRENRERISRIRYVLTLNADFREVEQQIQGILRAYPLPAGYRVSLEGRGRQWQQDMQSINFIIILGVILIYMCLAALFESFTLPLVIMLSIPMSIIGLVWFLVLTNTPYDPLMSGLGSIFLIGLLPNSAILLIYTTRNFRTNCGFNRNRALLNAASNRLRPILMTVSTTVLGLAPLAVTPQAVNIWMGFFGGLELNWMSFARVVIGGLISATILTLFVVPGFYLIVEDIKAFFGRLAHRLLKTPILIAWSAVKSAAGRTTSPEWEIGPREIPVLLEAFNLTRVYPKPVPGRWWVKAAHWFSPRPVLSPQMGFLPGIMTLSSNRETREGIRALHGVNLSLTPGVYGLLGPNGAGKTTLLRLLAGIDQPTRGSIHACGFDFGRQPAQARRHVGYLPQDFGAYGNFTGRSYLDYMALLKGVRAGRERKRQVAELLEFVNLTEQADQPVSHYSAGMHRRIGIAQLLLSAPSILIVDEPTADLDIAERIRLRNLLTKLGRDRIVLFSTHNAEDVEQSCNEVILLHNGKVHERGSVETIAERAEGCVWSLTALSDEEWRDYRRHYAVSSQRKTPEGMEMRLVSAMRPSEEARPAQPTLEEAYMLLVNGNGNGDALAQSSLRLP